MRRRISRVDLCSFLESFDGFTQLRGVSRTMACKSRTLQERVYTHDSGARYLGVSLERDAKVVEAHCVMRLELGCVGELCGLKE